jgi:hypothetical protein
MSFCIALELHLGSKYLLLLLLSLLSLFLLSLLLPLCRVFAIIYLKQTMFRELTVL